MSSISCEYVVNIVRICRRCGALAASNNRKYRKRKNVVICRMSTNGTARAPYLL